MTITVEDASILDRLYTSDTSEGCKAVALELAERWKVRAVSEFTESGILSSLESAAKDKKSGFRREAAFLAFGVLITVLPPFYDPILVPYVSLLLESSLDKGEIVREAGSIASDLLLTRLPAEAVGTSLYPALYSILDSPSKWQVKVAALDLIRKSKDKAPDQVATHLVDLAHNVTERMHETRSEVSETAITTMKYLCQVVTNLDIIPHLDVLVDCMAHPDHVVETIKTISATTFVQEVNAPVLAIIVPLLTRALSERNAGTQRQTTIVIDNLCKMVRDPREAHRFLPPLLHGVNLIKDGAAMPEVRDLARKAHQTLEAAGAAENDKENDLGDDLTFETVALYLKSTTTNSDNSLIEFVSKMLAEMVNERQLDKTRWLKIVKEYLQISDDIALQIYTHFSEFDKLRYGAGKQEVEEGEIMIVGTDFSLAYGGMMLLNHTNLTLYKGHKYGLCGANGAGKSTLMKSISSGKLEGFPSNDILKTCFVEHKLQAAEGITTTLQYIVNDPLIKSSEADIRVVLQELGFDELRQNDPVAGLSGGWKMKLELARAMLLKTDILLLDEPTNHLDVKNVKWLEEYLCNHRDLTCLIVSHDSGFLDTVCTDIIHYEQKKLVYYRGNLSKFVEQKPEAKSYYTLSSANQAFTFPPPSILPGVKSNTKAILRMVDVSYTYDGANRPSLVDATCHVSLSSRVAVIGPNGAGKSTLVKLLTGEVIPAIGKVDKHPNLRIGYVAQHAFHHVEMHLEKTPSQYLQWRYARGDDREVLAKQSRIWTSEEKAQLKKAITISGEKRLIEYIVGRQKLKKSYQYEIKWKDHLHKDNTWINREDLQNNGFGKLVQQFDDYEASREGLGFRELIPAVIREHFESVGLPGDIADHGLIKGLSGGQKVKVVIAAAMWVNPHVLVLDEPTNYLDRDALGGLAVAIRDWTGGVLMISHNEEFVGALCNEQWLVNDGKISKKFNGVQIANDSFEDKTVTNDAKDSDGPEEKEEEEEEDIANIIANRKVLLKKKKKLTRNEIKAQKERRRVRYMNWLNDKESGPRPADTESE